MKKFLLLVLFTSIIVNNLFATVRTVSNDPTSSTPNTPFFYTTLASAYTDCSSSVVDTLMIEGTNIPYDETVSWAKRIVVIGIGFNPGKINPRHSIFRGGSSSPFYIGSGGNGSEFYGIDFSSQVTLQSSVSGYSFNDCIFQTDFTMAGQVSTNMNFTNCVFTVGGVAINCAGAGGYTNWLFTSCIFNGWFEGNTNPLGTSSIIIEHCLFLNSSLCLSSIKNVTVRNSIFMNALSPANSNTANLNFISNISRLNTVYPPPGTGTNFASGNLSNTNPNFVTYTLGSSYSAAHNYALQAGSPAIGAGTGGSDIGLHGGGTNFNESGEVLITPIIRSLQINITTVSPNGTLNVQINASKPSDN